MKQTFVLFVFSIFILNYAFAMDVGDGSDGACTELTIHNNLKRYYQCTTLNINNDLLDFKGAGGAALVIKVQGDVAIAATKTIDVSGADGANGNKIAAPVGGAAGAGGSAGGNSSATVGGIGGGAGHGTGGTNATLGIAITIGGGGGGGSYKNVSGTPPLSGDQDGTAVAEGVNGSTYGNEATFDASFPGGSGGGAGGSGVDNFGLTWYGSAGGGGGGALRIIAGGNIIVDGNIVSNGGAGGGTGAITSSGGGGGGSGGGIWLQAAGTLTVTGSIAANGGAIGTNDSGFAGFGGGGGDGRIRLDSHDGTVAGGGTISPAAYSTTFTPTSITATSSSSALTRQYSSSIACGRVSLENEKPINNLINLMLGIMIASTIYFSISRKGKI